MNWLKEADLSAIYGEPGPASLEKVADHLTPDYEAFIMASRFCVLTTVGPEGTDGSPRGDDGPVARVLDPKHLVLPDWRGNDRIDSIRNIVRDGRVSLMFLVRGSGNAIRVNGMARVTDDAEIRASCAHEGKEPRTVIVVQVIEIYFQCARAIIRSGLWGGQDDSAGLPTPGRILANLTEGRVGGAAYDAEWPVRAAGTMW
ncbi:pyridoxamine 5'-phosphate oxidase family protein [Paracoccus caeni]|uniref:Pyridoxamine 5'-phosphate oxidase family protein n=1 Tax=Paracoccus caeni TaxID=657651 RepID=A0A934S9B2_9RHOB|nr:pyridoxamine 5'-phosphate oxidase family protein [Paracoccus caeni]MBK4214745.1 pyridoxamine 5'-phosphate oxidase family protein [Paracoccus caeni]